VPAEDRAPHPARVQHGAHVVDLVVLAVRTRGAQDVPRQCGRAVAEGMTSHVVGDASKCPAERRDLVAPQPRAGPEPVGEEDRGEPLPPRVLIADPHPARASAVAGGHTRMRAIDKTIFSDAPTFGFSCWENGDGVL
jgi:hypothetical protein